MGCLPALLSPLSFCSAVFGRLSRRKTRSSQLSSRRLRSKDTVEQLALVAGENGSVPKRVTRAAAAAAAAAATVAAASPAPESPTVLTRKPTSNAAQDQLVPVVEIGASERCTADECLSQLSSARAASPTLAAAAAPASQAAVMSDEESTPKKSEAGRLESVAVSSLTATPQDPKGQGVKTGRSASKLRIARTSPGPPDSPGSPASPWQQRVLAPILLNNFPTSAGSCVDRQQSARRSLLAPSSPDPQDALAQKYSLVAKPEGSVCRPSKRIAKKATKEPAASARIICESGGSAVAGGCWGGAWGPSGAGGALGHHPTLQQELSIGLSVMMHVFLICWPQNVAGAIEELDFFFDDILLNLDLNSHT